MSIRHTVLTQYFPNILSMVIAIKLSSWGIFALIVGFLIYRLMQLFILMLVLPANIGYARNQAIIRFSPAERNAYANSTVLLFFLALCVGCAVFQLFPALPVVISLALTLLLSRAGTDFIKYRFAIP